MFKLILVFVLSYISYSESCSCYLPQGWEVNAYCNAGFAGTFKVLSDAYSCGPMKNCYSIAVVQQFRGNPVSPSVTLETPSQSAACGVYLVQGNTYFIATNPINPSRFGAYLCGLLQDWTQKTCCEMIAEAKKYDCANIQTPIQELPAANNAAA